MPTATAALLRQVDTEGLALLPGVFGPDHVDGLLRELTVALRAPAADASAVRGPDGTLYAARNVLALWPAAGAVWRRPPLPEALAAILGPRFGLVRVLFFDKPPGENWALPWHRDLTIAVRDNRLPSRHFTRPTRKAGVPHVEAPRELLERMLTARIHLDDVTAANGPLKVLPGSHRTDSPTAEPRAVLARRGDVLLIRPLVEHCSGRSHPDTARHRRILHLEFAASPDLPDGYAWQDFLPAQP
jgi:hypothetical protein